MRHRPRSRETPWSHRNRAGKIPKIRSRLSSAPTNRCYTKSHGLGRRLSSSSSVRSSTDSNISSYSSRRNRVRNKSSNRRRSRSGYPSPAPQIESPEDCDEDLIKPGQTLIRQDITTSKWLYYGAYVGNETRTIEFKRGGGNYLLKKFVRHVLIYSCAFLNSEGGSLVVGVDDNGIVCGVNASHTIEDEARKRVDYAMLLIKPALFPFNYNLSFLPVLKNGKEAVDLKVLCLTFKAPSAVSEPVLYSQNEGEVYMRWDASVQGPLRLPVIVEWYRQKFPYWMNHCLCNALSRGPPFVDHRDMMDRIMKMQNYDDEQSPESEEKSPDSPAGQKSKGSYKPKEKSKNLRRGPGKRAGKKTH